MTTERREPAGALQTDAIAKVRIALKHYCSAYLSRFNDYAQKWRVHEDGDKARHALAALDEVEAEAGAMREKLEILAASFANSLWREGMLSKQIRDAMNGFGFDCIEREGKKPVFELRDADCGTLGRELLAELARLREENERVNLDVRDMLAEIDRLRGLCREAADQGICHDSDCQELMLRGRVCDCGADELETRLRAAAGDK